MGGQRPGQLLVPERLEVPGDRQMTGPSLPAGERRVRHLPDEGLHEVVLAAFGAAWIRLHLEQLTPDQAAKPGRQLVRIGAAHRAQSVEGERLSEDRRVVDEAPVGRVEGIEPGRDERASELLLATRQSSFAWSDCSSRRYRTWTCISAL